MKKIAAAVFIANLLWFFMFSPWTASYLNFWISMSVSASTLIFLSIFFDKKSIIAGLTFSVQDVITGLASAIVLWFVFYAGDYFSSLIFDFSKAQIAAIYGLAEKGSPVIIALLLLFLIGPAEEIFWRGFIQKKLSNRYGDWIALFITVFIYTFVHIWSFNFMLIMSSMVCGGFWGLLYKWNKSLPTLVISHAVWDVAVFVLFPI